MRFIFVGLGLVVIDQVQQVRNILLESFLDPYLRIFQVERLVKNESKLITFGDFREAIFFRIWQFEGLAYLDF